MFEAMGGIQTYSAFMLKAMQNLIADAACNVFLKNDSGRSNGEHNQSGANFFFAGIAPKKLRNYYFAGQIFRQAMWRRPDLVITTHPHFSVIAYYLKAVMGVPYWVSAHGIDAWDITNPSLKRALQNADLVLPASHYTYNRLVSEQRLNPRQVHVLPNTFDSSKFVIKPKPSYLLQRYGIGSVQPVILTVSRLNSAEQYKGYDTILKALPAILRVKPDAHYLIVGKGNDRLRIERMIEDLGLQANVTLAGYIPDSELCDHYNLCDVFAMPSKGEGFGIVFLEAMACGKPTLAGNRDGSVDALRGGELGVLVDPDNVEEIATALISILSKKHSNPIIFDPDGLRRKVVEAFGFEKFQANLSNILSNNLAVHSTAGATDPKNKTQCAE